jgi:hypothetical protein
VKKMKLFTIVTAVVAVIGLVFFVSTPVIRAEDSVRIQSYVESIGPGFQYFNYRGADGQPWGMPSDLGKAHVTIQSYVESIGPGFQYFNYRGADGQPWGMPTTLETIQPRTEEYTAQGCPGFVYIESEVYTK